MIFPESGWIKYINTLAAINKTAAQKFVAYLNTHDINSAAGKKAAIDYAYGLATRYGEMAAAASCEMYDAVAEASGVSLPAAEPAATATYGEVAKMYNGMKKQNQSNEAMGNGVGRLVKRAGADTTLKNALRDGAEFAWVPHGDTCSFCIMIASNGWRKASKKTIKGDHAEHIHANCDCTFAIRFDGKSKIEGYDPDKYLRMYENAEGDTWQEKLNSMRRDDYAANADKIREQKHRAYERRKENLSKEKSHDKIRNKFVDRLNNYYEYPETAYTFEEIEKAMYSSPIGAEAAEYIDANGYRVELYYDSNQGELAGELVGKDIYIYPFNNSSVDEISGTIIHELCHGRYGWDETMEDEVNCRLMEIAHLKGDITDEDIRHTVEKVRELYAGIPEGNLYGF